MVRCDTLLELMDESSAEIEPKHRHDDCGSFLTAAWKSLTAASLSVGCAAPADLIGLRVWAVAVSIL
jgi:hypothetical protein